MYDLVINMPANCSTTFARPHAALQLAIHEFDQWTNPKQSVLSPTTMCWCQADLVMEPAK